MGTVCSSGALTGVKGSRGRGYSFARLYLFIYHVNLLRERFIALVYTRGRWTSGKATLLHLKPFLSQDTV